MHLDDLYAKSKYKTRVLLCIYNTKDYDEDLKAIKEAARNAAWLYNFRIGIVSNPKLIKKMKKETSLFGDASMNSLILKRYDGHITYLDLLQIPTWGSVKYWMFKKSIKDVEEFSMETIDVINSAGQGVAMAFVDMKSNIEKEKTESIRVVNAVLPAVAKGISMAFITVYIDVNKYPVQLLKQFGAKPEESLPQVAFSDMHRRVFSYPI